MVQKDRGIFLIFMIFDSWISMDNWKFSKKWKTVERGMRKLDTSKQDETWLNLQFVDWPFSILPNNPF